MKYSPIHRIIGLCLCLNGLFSLHICAQDRVEKTVPYTVKAGETVYRIAKNHGTTLNHILALNPGLKADHIRSNEVIKVPAGTKAGAASTPHTTNGNGTAASSSIHPSGYQAARHTTQVNQAPFEYKEYKVKKHDTAYSLAKNNHITVEDLMMANPELKANGGVLKKGMIIRIPLKPLPKTPQYVGLNPIHVAVILPFIGNGIENERSVEFYRGMLMGIEELKNAKTNVFVSTYNEPGVNASIASLMPKVMKGKPDVIVGPLYPTHFNDVVAVASTQTKVAIPFSSKVPQVEYRPQVFVVNTPDYYEESLATDLFMKNFKKETHVVFLHSLKGDKSDFCQKLHNKLVSAGYNAVSLAASSTGEDILKALKGNHNTPYVVIPDDASRETLDKLLPKMSYLRAQLPGTTVSLVGYDQWIPLSEGDYRNKLHEADAYILSSNYYYPYTTAAKEFNAKYERWFKTKLVNSYPRMAPLGYDFSIGFLGSLTTFGHDFSTQSPLPNTVAARPKLQNETRFTSAGKNGGYVGRSMLLIHFKKDLSITKISAL